MGNEQNSQLMAKGQMLREIIDVYASAAGEAITSILKTKIEFSVQEIGEMPVLDVEYSILEPAIFVKHCLTSNVAGTIVLILRQRDMQLFLNELMGIDDLPDPDFVFDEVAVNAANEIMNQMTAGAGKAMADYLEDSLEMSACQLTLSDETGESLANIMGEGVQTKVMTVRYKMLINDMIESECIQCISDTAMDSLEQELKARTEKEAAQEMAKGAPKVMNMQEGSSQEDARVKMTGHSVAASQPVYGGNLDLIMDVPLNVSVLVGSAKRRLRDVLNLNNGSVVELDKQADAPVDIIVNGQLIARGEVVVIDDNFGVKITEIVNTKNIIGNGGLI
ncbi:flagellar motor switch protein FliN [Diplocloster hominis]|uniref:flagellar motor switch protein FliN n=1 Tax=Diplocloster hominis TaxID=3079010 RepID=UPI0031BA8CC1